MNILLINILLVFLGFIVSKIHRVCILYHFPLHLKYLNYTLFYALTCLVYNTL